MRRGLRRTFFRPERPTLTSRSLQSIARPFQKRFREVFGNARILIFYLSIKDWEEKSLPKSHLGWFFLVFGEGKATKENMSIFSFIWPLKCGVWQIISIRIKKSVCLNFNKTQINFKTYIFNSEIKRSYFYLVNSGVFPCLRSWKLTSIPKATRLCKRSFSYISRMAR